MKAVDARVDIYTATTLGRGRVASPTLVRLYPRERRLSEPQNRSGQEGVKEKSPPFRHLGSKPGHRARSQAPCRLIYLLHDGKST